MRLARASFAAAVLAAALVASPVWAGSFADREAARALADKGYDAYEAKRYREAIDLFQQAEARFHAPPHLLYTARAQVKLGLLVEARATFGRVLAEKLAVDAPAPFKEAQVSARAELAEVEARTPSLVVSLTASLPAGTRVLIDGEPLGPGDLGQSLKRDPGVHVLAVEPPGMPRTERSVTLVAGGAEERVTLSPPPPQRFPPTVSWVASFSVGVAGLVAGTTGAVLLRNASPSQVTPLRAVEVAGFVAGGLGVGAGAVLVTLWARAPASPAAPAAPAVAMGNPVGVPQTPPGTIVRLGLGPRAVTLGVAF